MNIVGKWTVKKTMYPTSDGVKHLTKDELIALNVDMEDLQMFDSVINFKDDGTAITLVKIPDEQIEAAKAEGAEIDDDGCVIVESAEWKEENGEYMLDQGGWMPLSFTEDGLMVYAMGMMLLEKA